MDFYPPHSNYWNNKELEKRIFKAWCYYWTASEKILTNTP